MSYAQTIANHMNCLWIKLDHDFHKKLDWVYFDLFLAITFVSLSKLQIIYQEVHSKCGSTIWQTINLNTIGFWKMLNYLIKGILWKVKNTLFEWHFSFYIKDYPLIHFTFLFMRKCDVLYSQLLSNLICHSSSLEPMNHRVCITLSFMTNFSRSWCSIPIWGIPFCHRPWIASTRGTFPCRSCLERTMKTYSSCPYSGPWINQPSGASSPGVV